jgi:hypothetical protein
MSEEGFEDRQKAGEQRIAERNVSEMDYSLEGPGSEERLDRLRNRFKAAGPGRKEPGMASLILIGLAIFLTILIFGLGAPIIEMLAPK